MAKDLNVLYKYPSFKPTKYRKIDIDKLSMNPVVSKEDWSKNDFTSLKRYVRFTHYQTQKRRCVYCRRKLNPLGVNEHIDHIVARSLKTGWMFKPRNLVLSCYQCNTQKQDASAIRIGITYKRLPRRSQHYILFNPYVHRWSDHFEIEDGLFIKARSKVGDNTIKELNLMDHKYSIIYADESNIFGETAIKRASKRMYKYPKNTTEHKSAKKLIKEIERHI